MMAQAGDLISPQMSHPAEAAPADRMNAGQVTAFGPGLSHGIAGQPCHFTIVTKDAGAGQQTNVDSVLAVALWSLVVSTHLCQHWHLHCQISPV